MTRARDLAHCTRSLMSIILERRSETVVEHEPRQRGIVVWSGNGWTSPMLGEDRLCRRTGDRQDEESRPRALPRAPLRLPDVHRTPGFEDRLMSTRTGAVDLRRGCLDRTWSAVGTPQRSLLAGAPRWLG
jgi:hypothetical protein